MEMTPAKEGPQPRYKSFKEKALPDEPKTDRRLELAGSYVLRERMRAMPGDGGYSIAITHTRLDGDGNVIRSSFGEPIITPIHEVCITGEAATRQGEKGIKAIIKSAREEAAARAEDHFKGMELMGKVMAERLS